MDGKSIIGANPALVNPAHLSTPLRLTYDLIRDLSRQTGYCYASARWLSARLEISESQLSRRLKQLRDLGLLAIEQVTGLRRLLRPCKICTSAVQVPCKTDADRSGERGKDSERKNRHRQDATSPSKAENPVVGCTPAVVVSSEEIPQFEIPDISYSLNMSKQCHTVQAYQEKLPTTKQNKSTVDTTCMEIPPVYSLPDQSLETDNAPLSVSREPTKCRGEITANQAESQGIQSQNAVKIPGGKFLVDTEKASPTEEKDASKQLDGLSRLEREHIGRASDTAENDPQRVSLPATTTATDAILPDTLPLVKHGLSQSTATRLTATHSPERIREVLAGLKAAQESRNVPNPAGWIVRALREGWEFRGVVAKSATCGAVQVTIRERPREMPPPDFAASLSALRAIKARTGIGTVCGADSMTNTPPQTL